ncbi:glycosyltransferase family 4 protein [uncultured Pseudoteredinibacter sp.]|uniref:glycosyltransferase family 4 protein n=1 Tax=uncultured Pseudoteredinibacter sp. TaxID=1641701 RepID=UPI00261F4BD7|nr:glycosyltransferase family 4 protein [uncultured Pseudoteredinibacter sp.]
MCVGGAERAIYQLIRSQVGQKGVIPSLLVLSNPGYYAQRVSELNVDVSVARGRGKLDPRYSIDIINIFKRMDYVHFHSPQPFEMYLSLFASGVKFVYTHRAGDHNYGLKRKSTYGAIGWLLRGGHFSVSANTEHAAEVAKRLFKLKGKNVEVTYNGVDFDLLVSKEKACELRQAIGISTVDFCIGITANLRALKRVEYLLRLVASVKGVVACIVGDGPDRARLERLAIELSVENRCFFVGEQEDVSNYLRLMDCFIFPTDKSESFGNSVVEAMGFGLPSIVMADSPGVVEHMRFEGGLVAGNERNLESILRRLMNDKVYRESVAEKGRAYVRRKYTYENSSKQYLKLYKLREM